MEWSFTTMLLLPLGLGLLGFFEPCSIGSSMVFIKFLEKKSPAAKIAQVAVFAGTRALLIGLLGAVAALVGSVFIGFQKAAWVLLGTTYLAIGLFYVLGRSDLLMRMIGPRISAISGRDSAALLGLVFGLNIPACAAPLIFALLGGAAAAGATGQAAVAGFVSLGLFGLALSAPLVAAAAFGPAQRLLDRLGALSRRIPLWTGIVLIALGLWSIGFAYSVSLEDWT
jgi:cytochrome c-type biogenesis protein